jgi:PAS domain S-box-containing protein
MYFYVSTIYSVVNVVLALIILVRSWHNVLSKFYVFCVLMLVILGGTGYLHALTEEGVLRRILEQTSAFVYAVFPFFFLHFMFIFIKHYEVLKSKSIVYAVYFAGIFCYTLTLLKLIPNPFISTVGVTVGGYIYYITWMSILFSVGVALLYSLIGGFRERGMKTNLLFTAFVMIMLLLPTPFTFSIFSAFSSESIILYTISSTTALAIVVYFIFRHRITMNTPYQAMKSALEAMNDIIIKTTADYSIDMAQGAILPLLGFHEGDILGKPFTAFVRDPAELIAYREKAGASTKIGEGFFTLEMETSTGAVLWMDCSITPVLANEEVVGFVVVGRNISERRRAELALQESEARYRLLAENSTDVIAVLTLELVVRYASPACRTLLGYEPGELVGHAFDDFIHPDDRERVGRSQRNTDPRPLIRTDLYRIRHRDGSYIWFETRSRVIFDAATREPIEISAVSRDVTERVWAEQALRESEERYRRFFEDDLTGVFRSTPTGRILDCNPAFVSMFGFPSTEAALAAGIDGLYPNPEIREKLVTLLRDQKKIENTEMELRRCDGKPVYVIGNLIGMFNDIGDLTQIQEYVVDITERKELEGHLRQSQKMENLGSLAGGIAHDFNNILGILTIHAEILRRPNVPAERMKASVDAISQTVLRGKALVRQLLTFARKTDVLFESVRINSVVDELVKILQPTFPKTIILKHRLSEGIPSIAADSNQLHQAILNLCVNARDAMPNGGTLTLATSVVDTRSIRSKFREASGSQYVCLSVSDTGTGMDEATKNRIFEPFFTTKEKGKGTGLGLAVAYGVVKSHHGFIDVESELGKGTTFRLYIEVPQETIVKTEQSGQIVDNKGDGQTILFVEDEEMLMMPIRDILSDEGFEVLTAKDGVEAVDTYRFEWKRIDVVLMDMGLPKLNGRDAFLKMKSLNPAVRAIIASGQMEPEAKAELGKLGVEHFVEKPYQMSDILQRIAAILHSRSS